MNPNENQLLLDTLGRLETNSNQQTKSLSRLETNMASLIGNGQPGRVAILEGDVASLKKYRYTMAGICIGVGAVLHLLVDIILRAH